MTTMIFGLHGDLELRIRNLLVTVTTGAELYMDRMRMERAIT